MLSKGFILLLAFSLVQGLSIIITKIGLSAGLAPIPFVFSRALIIGAISLLLIIPLRKEIKKIKKSDWFGLALLGLMGSLMDPILSFYGQSMTTASNAGFLLSLIPLFTIPFAFLFLKEKPTYRFYLSFVIMILGSFLLSTKGAYNSINLGDLLIILSIILVGFQVAFSKWLFKNISPLLLVYFRIIFGTAFLLIASPFFGKGLLQPFSQAPLILFAAAFILLLLLALFFQGMSKVSSIESSLFFILSAVFPAILAYLFLGERLVIIQWLGALLILIGGIFLVVKNGAKKR